jgi:hypothetical protein
MAITDAYIEARAGREGEMFEPFQKIPRLKRGCVITEKIDGTNAQILIVSRDEDQPANPPVAIVGHFNLYAGSRSRFIYPDSDNFGFAAWVRSNADELMKLGEGRHFGEWWGAGIQRRYGLDHKRFSLFNAARWGDPAVRPACCDVVPVLYTGDFTTGAVDSVLRELLMEGSLASPGFMHPEGIIIYHTASRGLFKATLEKDAEHKGATA